jgi:galactose mutarotase-like enzyme
MELAAGDLRARFAREAGMVCHSLTWRGEELLEQRRGLDAYAQSGSTMGIPLLYPWANRLGGWTYEALGREVHLEGAPVRADAETGLPIHGLLPAPFTVVEHEAARVLTAREVDEAAFPFPHRLEYEAALTESALRIRVTVTGERVPVCFGFHPYLAAGPDHVVELPERRHLLLDAQKLPDGRSEPAPAWRGTLGGEAFDDLYDSLAPAVFAVEGGDRRLELRFEDGFGYAQVFAQPGKDFICFEPMTAPADALRTGAFAVAAPRYSAAFSLSVGGLT